MVWRRVVDWNRGTVVEMYNAIRVATEWPILWRSGTATKEKRNNGRRTDQEHLKKAGSTLRSSRAVPHPSTNRALRRLTSEVRRDPVHSTRYGRQRMLGSSPAQLFSPEGRRQVHVVDNCREKPLDVRAAA